MEKNVKVNETFTWNFLYKGYVEYTDDWFLMSSPKGVALLVAAYLLFVLKLGPAYMKNKPAYELRNVLHVYNAIQVLYSCFLVYIGIHATLIDGFSERKCINQDKEYTYLIASGTYYYLMAKIMELLDTVFFVLRKKWNQITFLHVYHHSVVLSLTWLSFKLAPSYSLVFLGILNSFVHIVMYTYYGLSAFPGLTKYLWWKKYITKLQLVQFFIGLVCITINFYKSKCPQSYFLVVAVWLQCVVFMYMFSKFYVESYRTVKRNSKIISDKISARLQERFMKMHGN